MGFSKKEQDIIRKFYCNLDEFEREKMLLVWEDGSKLLANFDTCFEDDNELELDDPNYEEFCSFIFEVLAVEKTPPVYIAESRLCVINYKNFPDKIFVGEKQIN